MNIRIEKGSLAMAQNHFEGLSFAMYFIN